MPRAPTAISVYAMIFSMRVGSLRPDAPPSSRIEAPRSPPTPVPSPPPGTFGSPPGRGVAPPPLPPSSSVAPSTLTLAPITARSASISLRSRMYAKSSSSLSGENASIRDSFTAEPRRPPDGSVTGVGVVYRRVADPARSKAAEGFKPLPSATRALPLSALTPALSPAVSPMLAPLPSSSAVLFEFATVAALAPVRWATTSAGPLPPLPPPMVGAAGC
mmetsp:Transcript_9773/g.18527  ORF Transcript_9773/g.18527 Transcript_9773/m.18527 type:complete len:218 (-) Transcript_9773:2671-3324(-)